MTLWCWPIGKWIVTRPPSHAMSDHLGLHRAIVRRIRHQPHVYAPQRTLGFVCAKHALLTAAIVGGAIGVAVVGGLLHGQAAAEIRIPVIAIGDVPTVSVPEPGTDALLVVALLALFFCHRCILRRRNRKGL